MSLYEMAIIVLESVDPSPEARVVLTRWYIQADYKDADGVLRTRSGFRSSYEATSFVESNTGVLALWQPKVLLANDRPDVSVPEMPDVFPEYDRIMQLLTRATFGETEAVS